MEVGKKYIEKRSKLKLFFCYTQKNSFNSVGFLV